MAAGRKPGTAKTGGRQKGTPNKKSLRLLDDLAAAGLNAAKEFIEAVRKVESPERRAELLLAFYGHCYPKLKEIEAPSDGDDGDEPAAPARALPPPDPKAAAAALLQIQMLAATKDA